MADIINITDNATEVVAALNEATSGEFSVSMTATEFVGEVNDALDAGASVSDTSTELVGKINEAADAEPVAAPDPVKFLHYSDPHGVNYYHPTDPAYAYTTNKAVKMMTDSTDTDYDADIAFTILSGDNLAANYASGYYEGMRLAAVAADTNTNGNHLVIMGNHDAGDQVYGRSHATMLTGLKSLMTNAGVTYGGEDAAYWHKDYALSNGGKLRVFGTDEYDYGATSMTYDAVITSAQKDWFIGLLKGLGNKDYFIVVTHKPPFNGNGASAIAKRAVNKFCSSQLYDWVSENTMNTFAEIINAYKNGTTYGTEDWSGKAGQATFLCHLCGHIHGDYHGAHLTYSDQLVLCIDTCKSSVTDYEYGLGADCSDLLTRTTGIILNKVTIDFENERITIDRIGDKVTTARTVDSSTYPHDAGDTQGKEYPSITRDTITFDYTTAQVVESEVNNE